MPLIHSFLLLLICLVGCARAATPIRGCYATNWAQYRSGVGKFQLPGNYVNAICTHIFWAFAYVNSSFGVYPTDPSDLQPNGGYAQLRQLKQQQPGLKTLISIGGASFDNSIFQSAASSAANQQQFARNVLNFARQNGFDGVDIDWEYPTAGQKSSFTALMQAIKSQANGMLVTAAVSAGIPTVQQAYDLNGLKNAVDFLNVMTYDYHGSWDQQTGFLAPLYSGDTLNVNATIQYFLQQGFPASKIVLGVPTYARGWTLASSAANQQVGAAASGPSPAGLITQTAGILAYYEACQIVQNGASVSWNQAARAPFMQRNNQWYTYENANAVSFLASYSKQTQLAGCFVWTIDFDDFAGSCSGGQKYPLLNMIAKYLVGQIFG
ncbi:Cht7 [Aphelenchoides fujianensis]|nr:Cht7 [Aphelenchoides fujianensis]